MKKVNFTKMQSLGNDFIIIDNLVSPYNNFSKKEIKKICDRNYGVGCDQLLILKKSKKRHISFTWCHRPKYYRTVRLHECTSPRPFR